MLFVTELIAQRRRTAVLLVCASTAATQDDVYTRRPPLSFSGGLVALKAGRLLEIRNTPPCCLFHGNGDGGLSAATAAEVAEGVWEASYCRRDVDVFEESLLDASRDEAALHRLEDFVLAMFWSPGVYFAVTAGETIKAAQLRWASGKGGAPRNWWPAPGAGLVLTSHKGDIVGNVFSPDLTFREGG